MNDQTLQKLMDRAEAYSDLGRFEQALPLLHQALALAPQDDVLLCRLSQTYIRLKDWNQALEYANRAVMTNPSEEWGHRLCSISLRFLGMGYEALRAAQEAVRLDPENAMCLVALVHALRGCQQWEEAEATALHLLEVAPEQALTYNTLVSVYRQKGRWKEVERYARKALEQDAEDTEALKSLAEALGNRRRIREAISHYVTALRQKPNDAEARDELERLFLPFPIWLCFMPVFLFVLAMVLLSHTRLVAGMVFLISLALPVVLSLVLFRFAPHWLHPRKSLQLLPSAFRDQYLLEHKRLWLAYYGRFLVVSVLFAFLGLLALFLVVLVIAVLAVLVGLLFAIFTK